MRGLIDFSKADFFNPRWHRRVRLLLQGVSAEADKELFQLIHQRALGEFGIDRITEESLDSAQDRATDAMDTLLSLYRPWQFNRKTKEEKEKEEFGGLRKSWQKTFGSLDDPEVQETIARMRRAMLAREPGDIDPTAPMRDDGGIFNRDTADMLTNMQAIAPRGAMPVTPSQVDQHGSKVDARADNT